MAVLQEAKNDLSVGKKRESDRGDPRYGVADGVVVPECEDLVAKPVDPDRHRRGRDAHDDVTDDLADAVFVVLIIFHNIWIP